MREPLLKLDRLQKTFGAVVATDQCSLAVREGEIHALIGPNGAGKTTLISQISGELRPDSGTLHFRGQNITTTSVQDRVESGLVRSFQIPQVFRAWTVLENVSIAVQGRNRHSFRFLRRAAGDRSLVDPALECLASVELDHRAATRVTDLSHGEIRQLEIAMSLALKPRLLLLDEPMAGMGQTDSRRMMQVLGNLRKQMTMLLIEHDMDVVFSLSDAVTVLANGRPIASGSPASIRSDAHVRRVYLGKEQPAHA